jgi:hypothetical protein
LRGIDLIYGVAQKAIDKVLQERIIKDESGEDGRNVSW